MPVLDITVAALCIAFGATTILLIPEQIPGQGLGAIRDMSSSAFMPLLASLLIIACSVILLIGSSNRARKSGVPSIPDASEDVPLTSIAEHSATPGPDHGTPGLRARRFCLVVGILGGYVVLTKVLGMLISTAIMMVALSLLIGYRRPLPMLLSVVVTPILIYVLFERMLLVRLPRGVLF